MRRSNLFATPLVGLVSLATLIALLWACAGRNTEPSTQEAGRYSFEVAAVPAPAEDAVIEATARVTDRTTGRLISAPTVVLGWGEDATLESEDPQSGVRMVLELVAAADGRSVRYRAAVRHDGELVASEERTVSVDPARP